MEQETVLRGSAVGQGAPPDGGHADIPRPAQGGQTIAFTNVSVLPMDTNRVVPNQTVIISDGRPTGMWTSASTKVPPGAATVDGHGKLLMPGLAGMDGHAPPPSAPREFTETVLFLFVANGVTAARGMQGAPGQLDLRETTTRGHVVGPNLYLAGHRSQPTRSGPQTRQWRGSVN